MKSLKRAHIVRRSLRSLQTHQLAGISGGAGCAEEDTGIYCPYPLEISFTGCDSPGKTLSYAPAASAGGRHYTNI